MNKRLYLFGLLLVCHCLSAQNTDTTADTLQEVVITATRTEKMLSAVPMPVTLISQKQIQEMGSLRLNQVLQEQTGLAIVSNHGAGIQMQGLNPEYTLILIDGEPLIGRTAGTLELSRVAVGNIKQIEIIKGASSSLYGSEALAGVVNIITETPKEKKIVLTGRYGSNQTADLGVNTFFAKNKIKGNVFLNRYSSNGYDFTPETFGQTVEPFHNYTLQNKMEYNISKKIKAVFSVRYFIENQQSNFEVGTSPNISKVSGNGKITDFNINPTLHWQVSKKWKIEFRNYYARYGTNSQLNYLTDNTLFEESFFRQTFLRPEIQSNYFLSEKHHFVVGIGNTWETVAATRYEGTKQFQTQYAYFQYEYLPTQQWNLIFGGRIDNHTTYGSQFSPKFSAQYILNPAITLRASTGVGFKAPDFRQLYLNFNNNVAGYSVFGTEELPTILQQLQAQGQIAELLLSADEVGNLKAETSLSNNIGIKAKLTDKLTINGNFFRNDVNNLIESQAVARRTNGQNIFSYRNLKSIFTQGVEVDVSYQLHKYLLLSSGYQYLQAFDKDVLQKIKDGQVYKRNAETFVTTRVTAEEYGGLMNRSRHMCNIKAMYENAKKGISANIRAIYRGKYGLADRNGNLILDDENEYAAAFWTFNSSIAKNIWKNHLRLQAGVDNLFDYRDPINMPNLPGRLIWVSLVFNY